MNLDIMYFATYEEQKDLLNYFIKTNSLYVYLSTISKENDFLIKSFDEEIKKTYRKTNFHNAYFLNFDNEVKPREFVIKGEESISYSLGPSEINCNGIDVKACSYEDNMILFGRISTVFVNDKKIEAFKDLKKYMRGKFKKKGIWYVSGTIIKNKDKPANICQAIF